MVNFPVFFVSTVASATSSSMTVDTSDLAKPVLDAKASAMPLFGMAFTAFMAFMAFIAFIAFTIAEIDGVQRNVTVNWSWL